jgi:hypothetical protein
LLLDILFIATTDLTIADGPITSQFKALAEAMWLTQSVISYKFETAPRLWFVTKNATWVGGEELNLIASTIWGFAGSLQFEHPEFMCKRVDVDSGEVRIFFFLFLHLFVL